MGVCFEVPQHRRVFQSTFRRPRAGNPALVHKSIMSKASRDMARDVAGSGDAVITDSPYSGLTTMPGSQVGSLTR